MKRDDPYPNTPGRFIVVRGAFDYEVVDTHAAPRAIVLVTAAREHAWREAERYNAAHLSSRLVAAEPS